MIRYLAETERYKVYHEYETVYLVRKTVADEKPICIGDFYGDPASAIISGDQRYVVMCGCGIIIYYLEEPFTEFTYDLDTEQFKELFRDPENIGWIDVVYQSESDDRQFFRYVDEGSRVFQMDAETGQYTLLSD